MTFRQKIRADLKANTGNRKGQIIVASYRLANHIQFSKNVLVRVLGWPFKKLYYWLFTYFIGVEIPATTEVGPGLQVWHGQALVVNPSCKLGRNVLLRHCTTIGNKFLGSGCPKIGDNVEIGSHCVIIGEIQIGDNVVIGAGSVVTKSVPANSIAYGNPLAIKPHNLKR